MNSSLEYEIRLSGAIPASALSEIEGAYVLIEPVHTILRGPLPDQAALHGIINRLQSLGLDLIEVRRISTPSQGSRVPSVDDPMEEN